MSKDRKERALKIFKANPKVNKLFVNPKQEFFTTENLANNSVKDAITIEVFHRSSFSQLAPVKEDNGVKLQDEVTSDYSLWSEKELKEELSKREIEVDENASTDDLIVLLELKDEGVKN